MKKFDSSQREHNFLFLLYPNIDQDRKDILIWPNVAHIGINNHDHRDNKGWFQLSSFLLLSSLLLVELINIWIDFTSCILPWLAFNLMCLNLTWRASSWLACLDFTWRVSTWFGVPSLSMRYLDLTWLWLDLTWLGVPWPNLTCLDLASTWRGLASTWRTLVSIYFSRLDMT